MLLACVKSTGDYAADCVTGQRLALEYLAYEEADKGGPGYLPSIVADMPRKLTGIEVAFLGMVAYAAASGAWRARQISAYWDGCQNEEASQSEIAKPSPQTTDILRASLLAEKASLLLQVGQASEPRLSVIRREIEASDRLLQRLERMSRAA